MYVGVGVWHIAHIVVRDSVKLLIRVLLLWVRGDSHTMRDVCWGLKDGNVLAVLYGVLEDACGFRCSGQRFSRGQSAWAEERKPEGSYAWGVGEKREENA